MSPAPSVPGDDPVVTASNWLNAHSFCDLNCTENHRIAHCTVTGLHAVAATARIAAAEYKRERDEARARLLDAIEVIAALRHDRMAYTGRQLDDLMLKLDPGVGL